MLVAERQRGAACTHARVRTLTHMHNRHNAQTKAKKEYQYVLVLVLRCFRLDANYGYVKVA